MQVTMLNVGFGDCFLFEEDRDVLVVDCGSANGNHTLRSAVDKIQRALDRERTTHRSAMITHFHTDHVNGFKLLRRQKVFDRVYVPYIAADAAGRIHLIELAVYFYALLQTSSQECKESLALLNQISIIDGLVKDLTGVRALRAGEVFACGGRRFHVL